jgi:hypothetical protein
MSVCWSCQHVRCGPFQKRVFLVGPEIDQNDRPHDQGLAWFYFVLGYSAARTQVKVSRAQRHIHQRSFHCSTNPVDAAEYLPEGMPQADHVLLDFDRKEIHPNSKQLAAGAFSHFQRNEARPTCRYWYAKSTQFPAHCGHENQAFPGDGA